MEVPLILKAPVPWLVPMPWTSELKTLICPPSLKSPQARPLEVAHSVELRISRIAGD
jgi:hypothetical protein